MTDPKVTCFIPVYNGMPWLPEAVDSIRAQTMSEWECIIIDDASTDDTAQYLQTIDDPRFRILRNPVNMQVAISNAIAHKLARSNYLACLDADDIALPDRVQRQYDFMETNPAVCVCSGTMELFGTQTGLAVLPEDDGGIKANLLSGLNHISNPAAMLRLSFFREHGIAPNAQFPQSFDYCLWVECMLADGLMRNLPSTLTRYRMHASQMSKNAGLVRIGVRRMRMLMLASWFPQLTTAQIEAVEPLLHAHGALSLGLHDIFAGLGACAQLLGDIGPSRHGEDREMVKRFINDRMMKWFHGIREIQL